MSRDWDGDAISTNYNRKDMKAKVTHRVHEGSKKSQKPTHDVHMGKEDGRERADE